jgi:hypothetical protein
MSLDLRDCTFAGPAMPEPFVKYRLEELLNKKKLLAKATGDGGKKLQESWQVLRNKLRTLGEQGLEQRVLHLVLEPLVERLGWQLLDKAEPAATREGPEEGGYLLRIPPSDGEGEAPHLRAWVYPVGTDLDAPNKRGRAYRFSPGLVAQRVLLAKGERIGLLTDGLELRVLLSDPSGRDSHIGIRLDRSGGWRAARDVPDSFRLLRALCQPSTAGVVADLLTEARLSQTSVTKKLREQARRSVETFIQGLLDDPANGELRNRWSEDHEAANELWREGLVLVYRLLFILKLETSPDPARAFTFASSSLRRNSYSPSTALASVVERVRDHGAETGEFLAHSLRALFRLFSHGLISNELHVSPLGGMLFGKEATPALDSLHWSEQAVAHLLDALLWTPADKKGSRGADAAGRERVHYGSLDVEDLGRVYEALLELEPGIASEPMCRLRRAKLEVVVPVAQGAPYRAAVAAEGEEDEDNAEEEAEEDGGKGKTTVLFIEEIPEGRFYLRVGLGRKASGSYYTPHPFVRFLVQETLGPQIVERSPQENPHPLAILNLKVLDPAMGSGHFLVEACRFLGDALYEACRLCDERALEARKKADAAKTDADKENLLERARTLWKRVEDLPDPNDELVAYLPSRVLEGDESGLSQRKALALCRRLAAVHCLYGVDKNPLAVELARVSLWLESYAEGLPLTFLEHRLVCGDSLTGPFFEHLLTYPGTGERIDNLFAQGVTEKLTKVLAEALSHVRDLEATIGKDAADIELKKTAKWKLDGALQPLKVLAAAWAGGVMLGENGCDDVGYEHMLRSIAEKEDSNIPASSRPGMADMVRAGLSGVAYDIFFPEVFYPEGTPTRTGGFDVVLGNPPWEGLDTSTKEFFAGVDIRILDVDTSDEIESIVTSCLAKESVAKARISYANEVEAYKRTAARYFSCINQASEKSSAATPDMYQSFAERMASLVRDGARCGALMPSSFHANEGATGLRHLYIDSFTLLCCFSFENKTGLFDIHRSFKFALLVSKRGGATSTFHCAFYLHDMDWLFGDRGDRELIYSRNFLTKTTGDSLNMLELRSRRAVPIAETMFSGREGTFGQLRRAWGVLPTEELHTSKQKSRTRPIRELMPAINGDPRTPQNLIAMMDRGVLLVEKGEHFHQYDPFWGDAPTLGCHVLAMGGKESRVQAARYFRFVIRQQASSTNERTVISFVSPPGILYFHSALPEKAPQERPSWRVLGIQALVTTFCFDWLVRQLVAANVTFNFLDAVPTPKLGTGQWTFLSHAAVRLSCSHAGYATLWSEQFGSEWRENGPLNTWPVMAAPEVRWGLRSAVDAVVAGAYGLSRDDYSVLLDGFSHKGYPAARTLCLAAFDELEGVGLDTFVKRYDPYWDIPLITTLPKPAINLSGPDVAVPGVFNLEPAEAKARRGRARKGAGS